MVLWTTGASAAAPVSLDCSLQENSDGRTRELFTVDFDSKTVRVHYVDFNGDDYRWEPAVTYPATISPDSASWSEPSNSGPSAYVVHHASAKWTVTANYGGPPETADCDIWKKPPPGTPPDQ